MAYLQYMGFKGSVTDSVAMENGSFSFSGKIDEPRPASIVIRERGKKGTLQDIVQFFIEPGTLIFTSKSIFSNAVITGSPETTDKIKLDKLIKSSGYSANENVSAKTETRIITVPAGQSPPSMPPSGNSRMPGTLVSKRTITDINELPFGMQTAIRAMREEATAKVVQFIIDHPKSFVSIYTIEELRAAKKITYLEYLSLMKGLDPSLVLSNYGKLMAGK